MVYCKVVLGNAKMRIILCLMLNLFNVVLKVPTMEDPYEVVVLPLPTSVTDHLLWIFRQGIATRYDVSGSFCILLQTFFGYNNGLLLWHKIKHVPSTNIF